MMIMTDHSLDDSLKVARIPFGEHHASLRWGEVISGLEFQVINVDVHLLTLHETMQLGTQVLHIIVGAVELLQFPQPLQFIRQFLEIVGLDIDTH